MLAAGTKVRVVDENSTMNGKSGLVISERCGKIRVQILGFNRNGSPVDCSWHFDAEQLERAD